MRRRISRRLSVRRWRSCGEDDNSRAAQAPLDETSGKEEGGHGDEAGEKWPKIERRRLIRRAFERLDRGERAKSRAIDPPDERDPHQREHDRHGDTAVSTAYPRAMTAPRTPIKRTIVKSSSPLSGNGTRFVSQGIPK